jgi:hypothetical protein
MQSCHVHECIWRTVNIKFFPELLVGLVMSAMTWVMRRDHSLLAGLNIMHSFSSSPVLKTVG